MKSFDAQKIYQYADNDSDEIEWTRQADDYLKI